MIASRPVYPVLALRVVLAAALLCLLASCPQSIPELRGAVSIRLVSPEGRVLSQSASRTILPDFARLVGRIEINRYAPNATTAVATQSFTELSSITLADIDPGSWEFEAKLYFEDASEPFATGRSAATTIQEGASPTVNIPLAYQHGTGTGDCTISVSWPADDADALSWGLDALNDSGTIDQSKMNTVIYTDSTTRSATITITNAQAGARRLVLAFSKDNQNAGVFTESVNIFPGVDASNYIQAGATAATISFGQGRLLDTNASLASLTLEAANTTLRLSRNSPPSATATLTVAPTEDMQDYSWYLNGTVLSDNDEPTLTNGTGPLTLSTQGTHNLSYTATKDGLPYSSNTIVITVLPAATLVYNGNGHTGGTVPTWNVNDTTVAAQGDMVKSGYRFVGWKRTLPNGDENRQPGAAIPDEVTNNTADVVLYANWQNVAPPPVTNVCITPLSDSLKVSWQDPDVGDLKEVEVKVEYLNTNGQPQETQTLTVPPGVEWLDVSGYDYQNIAKVTVTSRDTGAMETAINTITITPGSGGTFLVSAATTQEAFRQYLVQNPSGHILLQVDINLSNWATVYSESAPFIGVFDGNGHTITMTGNTTNGMGGFLSCIGTSGTVKNLHIAITDTGTCSSDFFGGIAAINKGTIEYCAVSGIINNKNGYVGGIVGSNAAVAVIRYCYSTVKIQGYSWYKGGIAGSNSGNIEYSYARGAVSGSNHNGGLIGINESGASVTACYSTGSVEGINGCGGLVGYESGSSTNSFYDTTTSGKIDTARGTPKTTTEMKTQSTFTSWDFDNVWAIEPSINNGYPYLRYFGAATATP